MVKRHPLIQAVDKALRLLATQHRGLLLAVSGGADSTALLFACSELREELKLRLEVACLDHGLRPQSSGEVEWVRALSERLQIPFHTRTLQVGNGAGVEARARTARYTALQELCDSAELDFIATAHTASDQAETVFMRLARGTSIRGLVGIHRRRGRLIRPLLEVTREEVEAFLKGLHEAYLQDEMNLDDSFLRVRVRQKLLPAFREVAGGFVDRSLARLSVLMAEDEAYLNELANVARQRARLPNGALDVLTVSSCLGPIRRRILVGFLEEHEIPIDFHTMALCEKAILDGGTATVGKDWLLRVTKNQIRLEPSPPRKRRHRS